MSSPVPSPFPPRVGPLAGCRIIEIASLGPGPFAAMMLSDMGATVLRIERAEAADFGVARDPRYEVNKRGRPFVRLDLKSAQAVGHVQALLHKADALIEGFRPGVMERLGLGPEVCLALNPRLVYGRMTGWGQRGPLAQTAGHDINYLALSGTLSLFGDADGDPALPCNLLGDFGGGGMYLAFGIACALMHARASGVGQVVDASILDGVASLTRYVHGLRAGGYWTDRRASNLVDGGAPFYAVYRTADDRHVAVGAIERRFYQALLTTLGLADVEPEQQHDKPRWPALRQRIAGVFMSRSLAAWCQAFEGVDACFSPVLTLDEAPAHAHAAARGTFASIDGIVQGAMAPRFSLSAVTSAQPRVDGELQADEALRAWTAEPVAGASAGPVAQEPEAKRSS